MANKKQKIKPIFSFRVFRLFIITKLLAKVNLNWASFFAFELFLSPIRYKFREKERVLRDQSEMSRMEVNGEGIQLYRWDNGGPKILMVHGWSSRGLQFNDIIKKLLAERYSIIAFDAPGHGLSSGNRASALDIQDCIMEIYKRENLYGIVAHSLGGAASLLAFKNGLVINKIITIASPSISEEMMNQFCLRVGVTKQIIRFLHKRVKKEFNRDLATFFLPSYHNEISDQSNRIFVIHDHDDSDVIFAHHAVFKQCLPNSTFKETKGLKHHRILKNDDVINSVIEFLGRN